MNEPMENSLNSKQLDDELGNELCQMLNKRKKLELSLK